MKTTDGGGDKPYAPIACDRYSEYKQAIMHRQKLHLRWHEDNVVHEKTVLPIDLKTERDSKTEHCEEYLICRDEIGAAHTIRLDRINKKEPA